MEATESEMDNGFENKHATSTEKRVYALLRSRQGDRYLSAGVIAEALESYPKCVERALGSLQKMHLVTERVDQATGHSFWRIEGSSIEQLKHDMQKLERKPGEDEEDDKQDDDPGFLEHAAPDVAEILKAFENGANKIRNLGWRVEVQVRLSYPNLPTPGAS